MVSKFKKFTQKMKGQAMAEFALTIPVFLLLVFGIIELSRFFLVYSSVFTAVREATRYGSSVGDGEIPNYQNCEMITETAVRMGNFGGVQTDDVTVYFESQPGTWVANCDPADDPEDRYQPVLGDRVVVEIDTNYDSLLGIVPDLTVNAENGRTIMLGVQSQVAVINTVNPGGSSTATSGATATSTSAATITNTPSPTATTGQNPTATIAPTNTPSSTPTTPVVCPTQGISLVTKQGGANRINYVEFEIENYSNFHYKLVEIKVTEWQKTHGNTVRQLQQITINGDSVWPSNQMYEGPPVDVNLNPRNFLINSQLKKSLMFIFTNNTTQNINLKFTLTFNQTGSICSLELKN